MKKTVAILKRSASIILAFSLLLSVLSIGVYAEPAPDPKVLSVALNETRSYITLRFDKEIEPATSSFSGRIKLSKDGKSLASLSSGTKVSVSGYNMYITLSSPLTTPSNYFSINAGTLVGQNNIIETPLFDARGPELNKDVPVITDPEEQTVTLKFSRSIKGYPNNDSLKNGYITLARGGTSFNEVIPADDISIDSERGTITIYLAEWLTGQKSKFRIAAGKLQDYQTGNLNLDDITTNYIATTKTTATPEIDYIDVNADRNIITVYFTDKIKNGFTTGVSSSVATNLLKSHIWIGRGSSSKFETLGAADSVSIGSNYLKITLTTPLTSSRNYLKIEGSSLTDYYGNHINEDIITDNFTSGTSSTSATPSYASAFLSSSKKIVIYFTTPVQKNSKLSTSELRSNIQLSRNGGSYIPLTSYDNVSFSDNTMTITLREELTGSSNRVKILPNTVSSKSGILLSSTVTTTSLTAGMSDNSSDDSYNSSEGAPEFSHITYDSDVLRVKIYFDRNIRRVSSADFKENIYISRNGSSYKELSSKDVVSISPANALTILLAEPLTGSRNSFRIYGNTIADYESGYVQNETITTDYVSETGSEDSPSSGNNATAEFSGNVEASVSDDLYSVTLSFDDAIYNNEDSLEDLRDKIQLSNGGSFKTLSSSDYVRLDSEKKELLIMFTEPLEEYSAQIKIASGALRSADGKVYNTSITTLPLGEAGGSTRIYINEKAVTEIGNIQTSGTGATVSVTDSESLRDYSGKIELLAKIPSDFTTGTFNISGSVIEYLKKYNGTVALSLGNATHYIPASNITSIASGDTLSLTIKESTSTVSQKLSSASTSDSFTIEAPATNFGAKIITAAGASSDITHSVFSNKRFLLKNPSSTKIATTAVRIEPSGKIIHIPSTSQVYGGIVYINSKTLKDGDYAVISASRTITTVSWSQTPTNTLASRLILTNKSGSTMNGDEKISRAETGMIIVRTLGILSDNKNASPFFDVISSDSFYDPVMSAYTYKIIQGFPDGTFMPDKKLTRAEAMTIVARAMRLMDGKNVSASPDITLEQATTILSKFSDAKTVDNWAKVDIAECVQAGVVNGDNHGRLNPKNHVSRAELIQLMYNVLKHANII